MSFNFGKILNVQRASSETSPCRQKKSLFLAFETFLFLCTTIECCYGDVFEYLPIVLVTWKHCDGGMHHMCKSKHKHDYGMQSSIVYVWRLCTDKLHHDVTEREKEEVEDKPETDGTVYLSGGNNSNDKAAVNAIESSDSGDQVVANGGASAAELEINDNIIKAKKH